MPVQPATLESADPGKQVYEGLSRCILAHPDDTELQAIKATLDDNPAGLPFHTLLGLYCLASARCSELSAIDASGTLSVGENLIVAGEAGVDGDLNVGGDFALTGDLDVTGDTSLGVTEIGGAVSAPGMATGTYVPGRPVVYRHPTTHALYSAVPNYETVTNLQHRYIAFRSDGLAGTGTENDPLDGSTALKLDALWALLPANCWVHFGAGTFLTNTGLHVTGIKIISGMGDNTTVRLANNRFTTGGQSLSVFYRYDFSGHLEYFRLQDICVDGNLDNQSGVSGALTGNIGLCQIACYDGAIERVKFSGVYANPGEGFPISLYSSQARTSSTGPKYRIRDCTFSDGRGYLTIMSCFSQASPYAPTFSGQWCRVLMENNVLENATTCIGFGAGGWASARVAGNTTRDVGSFMVQDTHKGHNVTIEDNVATDLTTYGILANGNNEGQYRNWKIRRNTFRVKAGSETILAHFNIAALDMLEFQMSGNTHDSGSVSLPFGAYYWANIRVGQKPSGTSTTLAAAVSATLVNTFVASSSSGLLLTFSTDFQHGQRVRFTTTNTLPTGLTLATDFFLIRQTATTAKVATTYANALAGTAVAYTNAGTGVHTMTVEPTVTVTSATGVQRGMTLLLDGGTTNQAFVIVADTYVSGAVTVPLVNGVAAAHANGAAVSLYSNARGGLIRDNVVSSNIDVQLGVYPAGCMLHNNRRQDGLPVFDTSNKNHLREEWVGGADGKSGTVPYFPIGILNQYQAITLKIRVTLIGLNYEGFGGEYDLQWRQLAQYTLYRRGDPVNDAGIEFNTVNISSGVDEMWVRLTGAVSNDMRMEVRCEGTPLRAPTHPYAAGTTMTIT